MHALAELDHRYVWHPFTQMQDWLEREPIVIIEGHGAVLRDVEGRKYLDANSSIWTNLHGHNHPRLNVAIERQLHRIAHSSFLGLANGPAAQLSERLVAATNPRFRGGQSVARLGRVFFSDDGSTAMEVALKLAYEHARRGGSKRPRFLSLKGGYHGDTVGAVSLGHIDLFHAAYRGLLFRTDQAMSPYCYRCPFNRARPERADARDYRKCNWECVDKVEKKFEGQKRKGDRYSAFVVEPLVQGAAGMIPQPLGWLSRVAEITRGHGSLLIADEVLTGFGRTGATNASLFACHQEQVQPDLMALAKGLTGGYLPMAATLTTSAVFESFLGNYSDFKTFFHGHSFTGNQLGAAAALASLKVLNSQKSLRSRRLLEQALRDELQPLWGLPHVGDIRQVGLIAGIELVRDWHSRETFDLRERAGVRVCEAMARRGVLTRSIGNVIVLLPPYCTTPEQLHLMVHALKVGIRSLTKGLPKS